MKFPLFLLACAVPLGACAAEIPTLVLPAGVGVNIHFVTGHQQDLDLISAAGFKFIRMDFGWASIERRKGEYDWTGYEELLTNLDRRGIRALFIFDYSNPLYEQDNASPQHPESVDAFARWAAAAAAHFKDRHVIWEIWNEPNINFWKPKPNVEQYAALALATAKAVKQADPASTLIAPASSGFPWEFFDSLFKTGILQYLDAVSVHPYREYRLGPETAAADYAKLRQLIDRYAPAGGREPIPILSGEWGYASHDKGVPLETQAAFAARQQLSNLLNGVPLSIWYDWKNDGPNPSDAENNFGTVYPDLKPKPAYLAIRTLTHELYQCRIARRLALEDDKDYVFVCAGPLGRQKLVAWTLGQPHQVSVEIEPRPARILPTFNTQGERLTPKMDGSRLLLELGPGPQYVTLGGARVK